MKPPFITTADGLIANDPVRSAHADRVRRAALEWQVTLWSGEVTAEERRAFEAWRKRDPAHDAAWQQLQRLGQHLHAVPGAIGGRALRATGGTAASKSARINPTRRSLLRGLGIAFGAGLTAHLVRESSPWQTATADYRTARGEQRAVTLPDGTLVTLNTASAMDVRYTTSERRLILREGEILITTAPDNPPSHRPLTVELRAGQVKALGTRFTVRALDNAPGQTSRHTARVQVFDGAVEITPREGNSAGRIDAGEQQQFDAQTLGPRATTSPDDETWANGMLVAERQRLGDFLAELSRYRSGVLRCDPAVADLVVSGVYPLRDTDAVLRSLAQVLPVTVRQTTRYWVSVTAR